MADKKTFTVNVNGIDKAYENTVKLKEALNNLATSQAKINTNSQQNQVQIKNEVAETDKLITKVKELTSEYGKLNEAKKESGESSGADGSSTDATKGTESKLSGFSKAVSNTASFFNKISKVFTDVNSTLQDAFPDANFSKLSDKIENITTGTTKITNKIGSLIDKSYNKKNKIEEASKPSTDTSKTDTETSKPDTGASTPPSSQPEGSPITARSLVADTGANKSKIDTNQVKARASSDADTTTSVADLPKTEAEKPENLKEIRTKNPVENLEDLAKIQLDKKTKQEKQKEIKEEIIKNKETRDQNIKNAEENTKTQLDLIEHEYEEKRKVVEKGSKEEEALEKEKQEKLTQIKQEGADSTKKITDDSLTFQGVKLKEYEKYTEEIAAIQYRELDTLEENRLKKNEKGILDYNASREIGKQKVAILEEQKETYKDYNDFVNGIYSEAQESYKGDATQFQLYESLKQKALSKTEEAVKKTNEEISESNKLKNSSFMAYAQSVAEKAQEIKGKIEEYTTPLIDTWTAFLDNQIQNIENKIKDVQSKIDDITKKKTEGETSLNEMKEKLAKAQEEANKVKEEGTEATEKETEAILKAKEATEGASDATEKSSAISQEDIAIMEEGIKRQMAANTELGEQEKELKAEKEKLDEEVKKKKKKQQKVALQQKLVTAITDGAVAVTKAWAEGGPILGAILAAGVTFKTLKQINIIRQQIKDADGTESTSQAEDGGLLQGKRHKHGGMRIEGTNIEVEGDEYVVNRISTRKNLGLISYINKNRKELSPDDVNNYFLRTGSGNQAERSFSTRQMYEEGGQLTNLEVMDAMNAPNNDKILEAISQINFKPVVSVVDIASAQSNVTEVKDIAGV